ncbi:MAG: septum formation initiator family protein [Candidatus Spechtbacteria bacterium]|nr:septum formation initiator family protein [Candidatus Spechtbacteria bacterium]
MMTKTTISRALLTALLLVMAWFAGAFGKELYQRYQLQQDINKAREEVSNLQKDNDNLAAMIQSFNQSDVLELEVRRRLNVQKPGEQVVIVVPGGENNISEQKDNTAQQQMQKPAAAADDYMQDETTEDALKRRAGEWWKFVFQ